MHQLILRINRRVTPEAPAEMGGRASKPAPHRNAGAFDVEEDELDDGPGCCGCFAKGILSSLVALCLLGITGLSATAILRSKEDYWTAFDSNGQKPAFKFQGGWLSYHQQGSAAAKDLRGLGFPVWIMGVISGCALGVSFILAVLYLCVTIFSGARRHFRYISTPAALLLGAILAVFYILEALAVRQLAADLVKASYLIWPREGWAMGMGAALLWLFVSFFCCCIPGPRTQDYTKQVEPRPTQNPNLVYKAKSYPNTTTDPENVQPLNGKQQGVLDVEGAASPGAKSGGWFSRMGKSKSPVGPAKGSREGYQSQTDDIRKKYGDKMV